MNNSNAEIELLSQSVREQSLVSVDKGKEVSILRQKLGELQVKHECKSKELQKAMKKLKEQCHRVRIFSAHINTLSEIVGIRSEALGAKPQKKQNIQKLVQYGK